jgi:hypothetical protein
MTMAIIVQSENLITWQGYSDKEYAYAIYPVTENHFLNFPGSFIFTHINEDDTFLPLYVAHTLHLQHTISSIKKLEMFRQHGLSHIHIHVNWSDSDRLAEVKDLIHAWNPPCNKFLNF